MTVLDMIDRLPKDAQLGWWVVNTNGARGVMHGNRQEALYKYVSTLRPGFDRNRVALHGPFALWSAANTVLQNKPNMLGQRDAE